MLVVALVLVLVLGVRFHTYGGNVTGFIQFGERFVPQTNPPPGALIESVRGYDAQYFWIQARDPLLLRDATIDSLAGSEFRLQRMGYPTLAYALSAGEESAIPWSFLAINVIVVLGVTGGFAVYARGRGWSGWWALAVGLMPGIVLATMRDLSDPLAVASMLGGLIMWQMGRSWWAAALLTVAVLTREPMVFAVVAVGIDATVRWYHVRREPGALANALRTAWPAVVVPAAAFTAWQIYVSSRYGAIPAFTGPDFLPPFKGLVDEVAHALDDGSLRSAAWDLAYIGLILAGLGAAVALVRRGVTAAGAAALLFSLTLLVQLFGDHWSYTRLSAPAFACLLLAGLEQRSRLALAVCATGAAMTALLPLAFGASAGA